MRDTTNFLPMIAIFTNVLTVVIGALLARWIAGVVQNIKSDIRIAVLEIQNELARDYATKGDLDKVRGEIKLGERMDANFGQVFRLISSTRAAGGSTEVVRP